MVYRSLRVITHFHRQSTIPIIQILLVSYRYGNFTGVWMDFKSLTRSKSNQRLAYSEWRYNETEEFLKEMALILEKKNSYSTCFI